MPMKKFTDENFNVVKRRLTEQGYLVTSAKLARTGALDYLGREIDEDGRLGLAVDKVYRVNRLPIDVFNQRAIQSFEGLPITVAHPEDDIDAGNWKDNAVGVIKNVHQDGEFLVAEAWIYDRRAIELIEQNGIKELSCGYTSCLVKDDVFDFRQTKIRGNHVALVPSGRAGVDCRLGDERVTMNRNKQGPIARLLDVIGFRLTDEQKRQVSKLDTNVKKTSGKKVNPTQKTTKQTAPVNENELPEDDQDDLPQDEPMDEVAILKAQLEEAREKLEELSEILAQKDDVAQLARDAARFVPGVIISARDDARNIRIKVLSALEPSYDKRLDKMSDAALEALFIRETNKQGRALGQALLRDSADKKMDYNALYRSK